MKILIGCEFSGVVRTAFADKGHIVYSCDLLPAEDGSIYHIQDDIFKVLNRIHDKEFDIIILHPPCTHLAVSGNRWYANTKERTEAIKWTIDLFNLAQEKSTAVVLENPVGVLSTSWCKPTQYIQPWQFGHGETKKTALWFNNLPLLKPTDIVAGRSDRIHKMGPSPTRGLDRSRTYPGIAKAMADQWS